MLISGLSPPSPAVLVSHPGVACRVPGPGPGAPLQRSREMKPHKRSVLGARNVSAGCCAVPRKASKPEIGVLLPNERAEQGNSRCTPSSGLGHCSSKPGVALWYLFLSVIPCALPGNRGVGTLRGIVHAVFLLPDCQQEVHPQREGKVHLDEGCYPWMQLASCKDKHEKLSKVLLLFAASVMTGLF